METFIPLNDGAKINILKIKNETPRKRKINVYYYLKPVLGEDEYSTNGFFNYNYDRNNNTIFVNNVKNSDFNNLFFVTCSEKIKSFTGNKNEFLGNGGIKNPDGLRLENFSNNIKRKTSSIIALELEIELESLESKELSIVIGGGETLIECQDLAYKYRNLSNCFSENETVKKHWTKILNTVQVNTPIKSMNILLNGWLMYQTITSRMIGRTGFYQSGGAFGFRDQLQDCLSIKYVDKEMAKKQILKHSQHQFIEGDVEHWWHEETSRGIRTRFSDDLLWLPFAVADYIEYTGDYEILNEETNYLSGNVLENGVDEKYDLYLPSEKVESIYMHCVRAIEKSFNFGKNGLPKIGSGDWNDGFSTVGNKGVGESVWLAFFLCSVLNRFIPICKYMEKFDLKNENEIDNYEKKSEKYERIIEQIKRNVNTNAWDGRWFKRAFMDDGNELGSIQNDECKIDSIAQSWAVISNIGDNDKKYISMESLENHLVDIENGIIKLLDPPFENGVLEPGYIKAYLPGTRENGGQYTHAAIWVIIAEAMLGFREKAVNYFKMINPIEHSKNKENVMKYKVEPYVVSADIYGQGNLAGRGGWTWYTGSSSWMYIAGLKYILGININNGFLSFTPCVPKDWKEYSVKFMYEKTVYNIKIKNEGKEDSKVKKMLLNGKKIEDLRIKLEPDGGINEIEVEM